MKTTHIGFVALLPVLIVSHGCATQQPRTQKYYSHTEHSKMTYCIGMSDTAMYAATEKLKDRPKDQLVTYYASKPNAQLNIATVEKVYNASFTNAWDYTIGFFQECAQQLANVPKNRVNFASYCAQNTMIADVAYANKKYGYSKEKAYEQFAKFESKTPLEIVNRVYASDQPRAQIKLDVWNDCMAKISGD